MTCTGQCRGMRSRGRCGTRDPGVFRGRPAPGRAPPRPVGLNARVVCFGSWRRLRGMGVTGGGTATGGKSTPNNCICPQYFEFSARFPMRLKGAMFRPRRGECDVGKTDPRRHGNGLPFGRWHSVGGVVHALSTPTVLNQTRRGGERVDNPIDDLGKWRLPVHGAALRAATQHPKPFETGDVLSRRIRTIGQVVAFPEVSGSVIDPAPRFPPPAHRHFGG